MKIVEQTENCLVLKDSMFSGVLFGIAFFYRDSIVFKCL